MSATAGAFLIRYMLRALSERRLMIDNARRGGSRGRQMMMRDMSRADMRAARAITAARYARCCVLIRYVTP